MKPIFFKDQAEFRNWLIQNHTKERELIVGYHKVSTRKPSMTWSQSVDQALCFGWIDGIRRSIDENSYSIRFTPRKPNSNWSAVNIKKMEVLIATGQMTTAGLQLFENRKTVKDEPYSYENRIVIFPSEIEERFKTNEKAWDFFTKQAPSYKKRVIMWVMSAKQTTTFENRFAQLVKSCEEGKR